MRAHRIAARIVTCTAVVGALALALLAWMSGSSSGLRIVADLVQRAIPAIRIASVDGTLLGPLQARQIVYATATRRIVFDDVRIDWHPRQLLRSTLQIDALDVGRIAVVTLKHDVTPATVPADLRLPLAVHVASFRIAGIALADAGERNPTPLLSRIAGRFDSDGRQHRFTQLRAATSQLGVDAAAMLDGVAPFAASATATLRGTEGDRPFAIGVDAKGNLRDLTLNVHSLDRTLDANGTANLDAFAEQPLRRMKLAASGIDPASWYKGAPHARLAIEATLDGTPQAATAWSGALSIRNDDAGRLDDDRVPLRRLDADLRIAGITVDVTRFNARFTTGTATGSARWADSGLTLDARLAGLDAAAWHSRLVATRLDGSLDAHIGSTEQQLRAALRDPRFDMRLDATRAHEVIQLTTAQVTGRGGRIDASGKLDPHGAFAFAAQLRNVDPAAFVTMPHAALNATLDARGTLGNNPVANLRFALADSRLAGHPLSGGGAFALVGERLDKADLALRAGDNRLDVHGNLGRRDDRLTLQLDAPRLEQIGLGGALSVEAALSGALRSPDIEWKLDAPRLALPDGTQLQGLSSNGRITALGDTLDAQLALQRLTAADGMPPLVDAAADIRGTRRQHRLHLAAKIGKDAYAFTAVASGGLREDHLWHGTFDSLQWQGAEPLSLHAPATLVAGRDRVDLGSAVIDGKDWQAMITKLQWQPGRLRSAGHFDKLPLAAFVSTTNVNSTLRLGGDWDIDLWHSAQGHMHIARTEGDVIIDTEQGSLPLGLQRLGVTGNIDHNAVRLALDARADRTGTVNGNLALELQTDDDGWSIARHAPWQGDARLDMPSLEWLSPLLGSNVRLNGRLDGAARIGGTPATPAIAGQLDGADLRVRLLDQGLDLGGGTLHVDITPDKVRLQRLEFVSMPSQRPRETRIDYARLAAAPGRLTLEGEIDAQSGAGGVRLYADHLTVAQLPTRWAMVSGRGELHFAGRHLDVDGELNVDAAYVELAGGSRPTLSDDVVVLGRDGATRGVRIALDVGLDFGRQFYFNGAGLDTRLTGDVRLTAAQRGELRAQGTVRTVNGSFRAYGQELAIERGIVNFQGTTDNPGLNIRALRKGLPVEAGVEVTGTVRNPQARLVSEPEVPDSEKISWLVLGRAPDAATGTQDASLLLSAAMALQGNNGSGPMQSLSKRLGLDQLSIGSGTLGAGRRFAQSHVAGNFDSDPGTTEQIATIGKRIGDNATLSYERSIASAESVISLTIELTRRLSLVGRVGSTNSAGFLYSFAFGRRGK